MDLLQNATETDDEEKGCTTTLNGSAMKLVQIGAEVDDMYYEFNWLFQVSVMAACTNLLCILFCKFNNNKTYIYSFSTPKNNKTVK